jgi:DNA polymerase-3 subunit gamma/tau
MMALTDARETPEVQSGEYVVVARRYRPQSFEELVGQNQVSQALATAIQSQRVGHAYLFTGARGVGKTSTARIFAKALNCVRGPTPTPCNECDICQRISTGDDLDVLEIDGASNRGIDEIRQLRSNVNIRPSRARFKIYIIDEVHMLTLQAFNALLKTLEEPPEHVKFIFCTTDPEKIPITILSRCQRFDFPPVETNSIIGRLELIVRNEGLTAEAEALQLLARRANGSMRDSQSLLEQLLSSCRERITVADVHAMLGTARSGQLSALVAELEAGNVAGAFEQLGKALNEGVDAGQLAEQLVGYFRDMMAAIVGCNPDMMLHTSGADYASLKEVGGRIGLETLLAIVQVLDHAISRMRYSTHVRTLLEVALVRICKLGSLDDLADLVAQLRQGEMGTSSASISKPGRSKVAAPAAEPPAEKKTKPAADVDATSTNAAAQSTSSTTEQSQLSVAQSSPSQPSAEPNPVSPVSVDSVAADSESALTAESVAMIWKEALASLGDMTADFARHAERVVLAAPNRVVASFGAGHILHKESCERPERRAKLEAAMSQLAGRTIRVDFELSSGSESPDAKPQPIVSTRQRWREREKHPLVRRAIEMFDAEVVRVEEPRVGS